MMNRYVAILYLCILILFSCNRGVERSSNKDILAFGLEVEVNGVNVVCKGEIDEEENEITVKVPYGTKLKSVIAQFETSGEAVFVKDKKQTSEETKNDFTDNVVYTVRAADESEKEYIVEVKILPNSSKDFIQFGFLKPQVEGRIDQVNGTIHLFVPFGTAVDSLVPVFKISGKEVRYKDKVQESGKSFYNFSKNIEFTVIADDKSEKRYTVVVDEELVLYHFTIKSPFVEGVINQDNNTVQVSLPYGTNTKKLIASFKSTSEAVMVEGNVQSSGKTENDFSKELIYRIFHSDSLYRDYTVKTTVLPDTLKEMSKFSFVDPKVSGEINQEKSVITIKVPAKTDLTKLVAKFSFKGKEVRLNGEVQKSEKTVNDFSQTVIYSVFAKNGTFRNYTVQAYIPDSTKEISYFSFVNPSVKGVIYPKDKKISIDIPYVSEGTKLRPIFQFNGDRVEVNGKIQVSGSSVVDFKENVYYDVFADDGSKVTYEVRVKVFNTGVPTVIISTEKDVISKEVQVKGTMKIVNGDESLYPAGGLYDGHIGIRGRGFSSWNFPKKSYAVELWDKNGKDIDRPILDMREEEDWVLLANYSDKSLMRGVVAFDLGKKMGMPFVPEMRFVDVIMNGDYRGAYFLGEKIKRGKNRVDIVELTPSDKKLPALSGGYLLELVPEDRITNERYVLTDEMGLYWCFKSPKSENVTARQQEYMAEYLNDFERALESDTFDDTIVGYPKYVDVESFVDWVVFNEIFRNNDVVIFHASVYMYKDRNGKLKMGPLWDFDIALGNINYSFNGNVEGWSYLYSDYHAEMMDDSLFAQKCKDRWAEIKPQVNSLFPLIDSLEQVLHKSHKKQFEKWDILGEYVWPNPDGFEDRDTYAKEVAFMKKWLQDRVAWIDANIHDINSKKYGRKTRGRNKR